MSNKSHASEQSRGRLPEGIFAAALTPMKDNLEIDDGLLLEHCHRLLEMGCDGVCLFGTTGEAASFSRDERIRALDNVVKGGFPPEKLLVGTGCCAGPDTVALTRHAMDRGAGGVLMIPPFYYKDVSEEGVLAAHEQMIEHIDGTGLNLYLYHYPYMSGVSLSRGVIRKLVSDHPEIVVGIKDSSGDLDNLKMIRETFPGLEFYPGTETLLLDGLKNGASGCISATINVTAPLAAKIFGGRDTTEAAELQIELTAVRRTFDRFPLIGALKHLMAARTGQERWGNVRPPIVRLRGEEAEKLERALDAVGFTID